MNSSIGRRRSKNLVQETKSLGQITECLADWLPNRLSEDVGEDMVVQIEDDGVWSGLAFWLQAKSTTDLDSLRLKKRPEYSYPIGVEDLLRWEATMPPVVIVVWDTEGRKGVWIDVPDAINRLDEGKPDWRSQKSVQVYFSTDHRLDLKDGRTRLRRRLADLALPALAKGKEVKIEAQFAFATDEEGRALAAQFKETIEKGEKVTLPGHCVKEWKLSPWWERVHGPNGEIKEITIGPAKSDAVFHLEFVSVGETRAGSIRIALPQIKAGRLQAEFSNVDTDDPLRASVIVPSKRKEEEPDVEELELKFTLSFTFPTKDLGATKEMANFLVAAHEVGSFQVRLAETGGVLSTTSIRALPGLPDRDELLAWERMLHKLTMIETKTARYGRFDLSMPISNDDLLRIERLYLMSRGEPWESSTTLTGTLSPDAKEIEETAGEVSMEVSPFATWEILGVQIPLGTMKLAPVDGAAFIEALNAGVASNKRKFTFEGKVMHHLLSWGDPSRVS